MKLFYTCKDIMEILNLKEGKCYDIIKIINKKQEQKGFRTEKGRVLVSAFEEEYGIERGGGNEKNNQLFANSSSRSINLNS